SEGLKGAVEVPYIPDGYKSAWAQYSVISDKKEELMKHLQKAGIPTAVYYPRPLHLQTAFAYLGYKPGSLPVSEKASERIFSLPMHPYLEEADQQLIIKTILQV
ncbi:MAG: DegT/DnrJ/EryC1/StrS family aminotransferase, partial [Pseudomonadota bacterium]